MAKESTRRTCGVAAIVLASTAAASRAVVILHPLADPLNNNAPTCISDGGSYVMGYSQDSGQRTEQIRWTPDGTLATVAYAGANVIPTALASDGHRAVGYLELSNGAHQAYSWTESTGITLLIGPSGATSALAFGISRDGSIALGTLNTDANHSVAIAWTPTGFSSYFPAPGSTLAAAYAASNTGSLIVGSSWLNNVGRATTWTTPASIGLPLPMLPGFLGSQAGDVSADGHIIAGKVTNSDSWFDSAPVVWVNGSIQSLPLPTGATLGTTFGMSDDGSVILGNTWGPGGNSVQATLWVEGEVVTIRDLLIANGISPSLASSMNISAISRDGLFISAWSSINDDQDHPYVIQIPAPSAPGILLMIGLMTMRRRRFTRG